MRKYLFPANHHRGGRIAMWLPVTLLVLLVFLFAANQIYIPIHLLAHKHLVAVPVSAPKAHSHGHHHHSHGRHSHSHHPPNEKQDQRDEHEPHPATDHLFLLASATLSAQPQVVEALPIQYEITFEASESIYRAQRPIARGPPSAMVVV